MGTNNYRISDEHFTSISTDEAKFIFEETEKRLTLLIEANKLIVDRSTTLLTIAVGLMIGIFAYIAQRWIDKRVVDELILSGIFWSAYLFKISLGLVKNLIPLDYLLPGREPQDMYVDTLMNFPSDKRPKLFYITQTEYYQMAITKSKVNNHLKWQSFRNELQHIIRSPFYFATFYIVSTILFPILRVRFGC